MAELTVTDVFPNATQTATSITIPYSDLHPSLVAGPDLKAEPIIAALIWQLKESGLFPDSGLDVVSDQSISVILGQNLVNTDFDTGQEYFFRELQFRLREPYSPTTFNASIYG